MAAMLNKHGAGELWFGVKSDGSAVGLEVNEKTLRDVSQTIAAHIEPRIYPQIAARTRRGAKCIQIVFSGSDAPYFAYGRSYVRVADEDRQMSARELEKFFMARNRDGARWDSQPGDFQLRDMDAKRVARFLDKAGLKTGRANSDLKNALEKLGVLKGGVLLQAAPLFFAKHPPLQLRCAVFAGATSAHLLDQHDFDGDILELIEEAQKYILKNIRIGMKLNGFVREDVPEISMEALRETIINAFCHRDWREPDHVRVAIYPDRVEIRSPGGLPDGLTVERMRQGGISCRRNPLIADLLRRVHLVEAWGRGMPLILEKAPQVEFEGVAGTFVSRFPRPAAEKAMQKTIDKAIDKAIDKTIDRVPTEGERQLIAAIEQNPAATQKELAAKLGLSEVGIRCRIDGLKSKGLLRRIGGKKIGRWEVQP